MADPEDQIPPIPTPPAAVPPVEAAPVAPPPPAAPATPYGAPAAPYAPAGQQAPYQPGYPQQYQAQAAGPPRGISLASMICGIAGAALGCCGAGFLPGLAGVILGHLAQKQQPYAKGMWLTGLITGYAGIGLSLIAGLIWIASAFAPLLFLPFAALAG